MAARLSEQCLANLIGDLEMVDQPKQHADHVASGASRPILHRPDQPLAGVVPPAVPAFAQLWSCRGGGGLRADALFALFLGAVLHVLELFQAPVPSRVRRVLLCRQMQVCHGLASLSPLRVRRCCRLDSLLDFFGLLAPCFHQRVQWGGGGGGGSEGRAICPGGGHVIDLRIAVGLAALGRN